MQAILITIAMLCAFIALIIFFQALNNAFKKGFLWGIIYLIFPIGSYFYYKKFITEEKNSAIGLSVCLAVALVTFMIAKLKAST